MSEGKVLSAEDILGADDLDYVDVKVPEWGGVVRLRTMSAEEAIEFARGKHGDDAIVQIIARTAINTTGQLLFNTPETVEKLRTKNFRIFRRLERAALKQNGLAPGQNLEADAKND